MSAKFIGELIGTFILVLLGCGIVGVSLIVPNVNLIIISVVWGIGVFFGILAAIKRSDAHLNPAVSLAFLILGDISPKDFINSVTGQLVGAFIAACVLFLIFNNYLAELELMNGWSRSDLSGQKTAKMFGEFYNPEVTTLLEAGLAEALGTFFLVVMILFYVRDAKTNPKLVILFIAATVSILIVFIAPITQCGINPARDFAPRAASWLFGWKKSFQIPDFGAIVVYVLSPLIGATVAVLIFRLKQFLTIN